MCLRFWLLDSVSHFFYDHHVCSNCATNLKKKDNQGAAGVHRALNKREGEREGVCAVREYERKIQWLEERCSIWMWKYKGRMQNLQGLAVKSNRVVLQASQCTHWVVSESYKSVNAMKTTGYNSHQYGFDNTLCVGISCWKSCTEKCSTMQIKVHLNCVNFLMHYVFCN